MKVVAFSGITLWAPVGQQKEREGQAKRRAKNGVAPFFSHLRKWACVQNGRMWLNGALQENASVMLLQAASSRVHLSIINTDKVSFCGPVVHCALKEMPAFPWNKNLFVSAVFQTVFSTLQQPVRVMFTWAFCLQSALQKQYSFLLCAFFSSSSAKALRQWHVTARIISSLY